jgi:predicted phosphodiesterase
MRIGLVTDIHNQAAELERALAALLEHGVERIVTLGDTCDAFAPAEGAASVVAQLRAAGAIGVWGNHDFTLCRIVPESVRRRYDPAVLEFMAGMQPWLEIDDCRFSHEEPYVDPHDPLQLWSIDEDLDLLDRANRSFAAAPHRCFFLGHYHRWLVATPLGRIDWAGRAPLVLEKSQRYFVVIAPVMLGWCAVLDTSAAVLHPICCADAG